MGSRGQAAPRGISGICAVRGIMDWVRWHKNHGTMVAQMLDLKPWAAAFALSFGSAGFIWLMAELARLLVAAGVL